MIKSEELDPITATTPATAITFSATGTINLKVNRPLLIKESKFRKLFKLKQNHEEKS